MGRTLDDIEPIDPHLMVAVNAVLENDQYKAERAVIEAAKALTDACEGGNPLERNITRAALLLTVEALQEVEGE